MRKARALLLLLLLAPWPSYAQRGGEPELMPAFKPVPKRKAPKAEPLKDLARPVEPGVEEKGYDILPAKKPEVVPYDLNRKPKPISLGAKDEKREFFRVRSRFWFFKGGVDTRYAYRLPSNAVSPPSAEIDIGETEKRGADGLMRVDSLEFAPLTWLSFVGEYGQEKGISSTLDDRFWVHSPNGGVLTNFGNGATWTNPEHEDDLIYSARSSGKMDWAAGTMYARLIEARIAGQDDDSFRHSFDLGVGAQRLRVRQRFTDLVEQPSPAKLFTNTPGPIAGYDATYDSVWEGFHVALREIVRLPARFSVEGEALWSPVGLRYRGDGYDNFRRVPLTAHTMRAESPNYEDRANGSALHFRLSGQWTYGPFTLEGGYSRLYFYSRTGRRKYFLNGGTSEEYELNFARTDLGGAFVGGVIRF